MSLKVEDTFELSPINLVYSTEIFESFDKEIVRFLPLPGTPEKIEETVAFIEFSIGEMKKDDSFLNHPF